MIKRTCSTNVILLIVVIVVIKDERACLGIGG